MYRTSAYPHLLRKFSDGDTTVLHDHSPHLVNELVISACWGPTKMSIALHRRAAIFELVVPLVWCPCHRRHNPLNLPNGFHLAIAKLLAKFDAILLLESFVIFAECDACCVYTLTHTMAARDWCCLLAGKNPRTHMTLLSTSLPQHTFRASLVSTKKNHVRYFLNSPRISPHVQSQGKFPGFIEATVLV